MPRKIPSRAMTATVVINPSVGDAVAHAVRRAAEARDGFEVVQSPGGADPIAALAEVARRAGDLLIVAGGDGSVHAAANALATLDDPPRLGVLPAGSGNDFAAGLNLPREPAAYFDALESARPVPTDLIELKAAGLDAPVMAINAVTAGLSRLIHEQLDDQTKAAWGRFSYARAAAEVFRAAPDHRLEIDLGTRTLRETAVVVAIFNGVSVGGVRMGGFQQIDDGLMDLVRVDATTTPVRLRAAAAFVSTDFRSDPSVRHDAVTEVRSLHADPPLEFVVDGEPKGRTPASFTVRPAAMEVLAAS